MRGIKDIGQFQAVLQIGEQVLDQGPDQHIKGRDGFIEDDHFRLQRDGAGDTDAMTLAAAKLMRVGPGVVGQDADLIQQFGGAGFCLSGCHAQVDAHRLGHHAKVMGDEDYREDWYRNAGHHKD